MHRVRTAAIHSAVLYQASNRSAFDLNDPLLDQPVHRFAHRLDRSIAGPIAEHALRFGDAAIGAVGYVIVSLGCLQFILAVLPFHPRQIAQLRLATEHAAIASA